MPNTETAALPRPSSSLPFYLSGDFKKQSTPKHIAIIMDGNRRWARRRGLPDGLGHRKGAAAVEKLLPAFRQTGVQTLSLFGFSAANWQRDEVEVRHLLNLAESSVASYGPRCLSEGIAVEVIGRRDRLPDSLVRAIENVERMTAAGDRRLRIAFDYSSREAILKAARDQDGESNPDECSRRLGGGDVDLLIRTGREQRLSDFMLWECAFAELYFPDLYWPDFNETELSRALNWYGRRARRFGR